MVTKPIPQAMPLSAEHHENRLMAPDVRLRRSNPTVGELVTESALSTGKPAGVLGADRLVAPVCWGRGGVARC